MIRKIAAVAFGVLIAITLIIVVQMISHAVYAPPPGFDVNDPDAIARLVAEAPTGALLLVILSYVVGAFGGGMLAALVARETPLMYAAIVGAFVLLGTIMNLTSIPHPTWFAITSIAAIVATVLLTGRIAPMMISERPGKGR
jgi:hypothetical protein